MQTSDVMHGSRGTSQIVVVVVATQELPDTVEIGSMVVLNDDVSGGNGGKDSEDVVNWGGPVGVIDTIEGVIAVEEDEDGGTVKFEDGTIVANSGGEDESDDKDMLVLDGVWVAVPERLEADLEVNVTVAWVNRGFSGSWSGKALQTDSPGSEMVNTYPSTIYGVLLTRGAAGASTLR